MTYVLIPGAGGSPWHWHRLAAELRSRGQAVLTPDLPGDDDEAGFAEYADAVLAAIGEHRDLILVAHSLAGFTAPLVCERVPVDLIVLAGAMIPSPGETARAWWHNTGHKKATRATDDPVFTHFHDLPPDEAADAVKNFRTQSGTPFHRSPPPGDWPQVPTRFLLFTDDRMFPPDFQRRLSRDRLGIEPDETPGGHFAHLSHPVEFADRLEGYQKDLAGGRLLRGR